MGSVAKQLAGIKGVAAQIAFNLFNYTHFERKPITTMYGHYNKIKKPNDYREVSFNKCLNLMAKYPITERLGLSLNDLLDMDQSDLKSIELHMEEDRKFQKKITEQLKQSGGSNGSVNKVAMGSNRPIQKRVRTTKNTRKRFS